MTVEDSTSRGRADMTVHTGGRVYVFEFKVVEQAGPGAALAQLQAKELRGQVPRHWASPFISSRSSSAARRATSWRSSTRVA